MVLNAVSVVTFDHKSIISSNVFVLNHYKPVIKPSATLFHSCPSQALISPRKNCPFNLSETAKAVCKSRISRM